MVVEATQPWFELLANGAKRGQSALSSGLVVIRFSTPMGPRCGSRNWWLQSLTAEAGGGSPCLRRL